MLEPSGGSDSSELDQQIAPQEKELINRGQRTSSTHIVPATPNGWSVGEATADILPDDALLTIFFLHKEVYSSDLSWWEPLVHVCRR